MDQYEACIELSTRAGGINMPDLPRCALDCFLIDSVTGTKIPMRFDATNIIKLNGVTCGSIQLITVANIIVWSSFEPSRFTLYIARSVGHTDQLLVRNQHKIGRNSYCI